MSIRNKIILCLLVLLTCSANSQTKVSVASGNWSDPTKWSPSGVPSLNDNVFITNGNAITLDVNSGCNSLTIGSGGGNAHLVFTGNTALSFTINSDVTISSASSFSIMSTSNTTHSVIVNSSIVNNGTIRFYQDINSLCDVVFTKNGNQTVSGSGIITRFNLITLNMGNSINNVLEISTPSFSVANNFLTLLNGTFKLSTPGAVDIEPFRFITTIPSSASFWLNSPQVNASTNAGINLNGQITISAGQLSVGNSQNEDLSLIGGTLTINGGTLNVAGKCYANSLASVIQISAGELKLPTVRSTNTTISPFHFSASGSSFVMSGGRIIIESEGGNGNQDLGFNLSNSINSSITSGTIQIGNSNSPVNQTISLNSSSNLPNLEINSSNVSSKIINNDLHILSSISIKSGTLISNNFNITLGGDWYNFGAFNPSNATVTFSSNALQNLMSSNATETFNTLRMSGSGTKTFSCSVLCSGNFSVDSTTPIDFSNSSNTLTLKSNFFNNGFIQPGNSLILFNGTGTQNFFGSSITNFFDLTIQNSSGVSFSNSGKVEGTLSLKSGTLNLNGQTLTLVSNSLTTGRIAEITGSGDISGTVIVERCIPGGSTGWVFLGTPIASSLTLNDWDDDIYISCPTCPDGYVSNFSSIYTYDETVSGTYDAPNSYVPLNSINDPIISGKGYWVYLGDSQTTTNDITIDMSGSIRKFMYAIPLDYTNNGSTVNDGWNLIHNPYPSSISWAALKGTTTNIDNAIYIYNPDLSSGGGAYASYVNGISSPAVNSGGISDNIAMCQGFYVHSTGATALIAQESNKVAVNQTFLKSNSEINKLMLRLTLLKDSLAVDETVLYFEEGAHKGFDQLFDAFKMRPSDPLAALISFCDDSTEFQINGVEPFKNYFSIPVKTTTGINGSYKIKANEFQNIPYGMCVQLYDKTSQSLTDLLKDDYSFYLSDTTLTSRFELRIKLQQLEIDSNVMQPTCLFPTNGHISVKGVNNGPWNYRWKKEREVIKETFAESYADTLSNLREGIFKLEVNTDGFCDNNTSYYKILKQSPVGASFLSEDTVVLKESLQVLFTNTSSGANQNFWYSELNNEYSNLVSPVFSYSTSGNYRVKLICESATGCKDSIEKRIVILDTTVFHPISTKASKLVLKNFGNNHFKIEGVLIEEQSVSLSVCSADGKEIYADTQSETLTVEIPFYIQEHHKGVFLIRLQYGGNFQYWKVILN